MVLGNNKTVEALQRALTNGSEEEQVQAWNAFSNEIVEQIKADAEIYAKSNDKNVLAQRGYRQLTTAEEKFYNKLIEASKIDGATKWQTLRHVTIPMVMPSITICLFLTLSNSFKLYDQNLALTAGAPIHKTEMLALNIVNSFYGRSNFEGVGQAKAVMFFIIVACIALSQLYYTRKREVEQ